MFRLPAQRALPAALRRTASQPHVQLRRLLSSSAARMEAKDVLPPPRPPPAGEYEPGAAGAATVRELAENARSLGSNVQPDFEVRLEELAAKPATAVSLKQLWRVGHNPTPEQSLLNAQFLRRELSVRFAQRAMQLSALPLGLSDHRAVQEAADIYRQITALLLSSPSPRTFDQEEDFARILRATKLNAMAIPTMIGRALTDLRQRRPLDPAGQRRVDQELDNFFSSRIGHRFLIEHYIASKEPREGFSGVIQARCSPVVVCEEAALAVARDVRRLHGTCPHVSVIGDREHTFTYLPSHIYFIVNELLKNACSATVRHMQRSGEPLSPGELPPVRVIVARGEEDMTIKIEDQGGGIARSKLGDVWSYKGSWSNLDTADEPELRTPIVGGDAAPLAKRGLGLPISRLYAKYFGGTLHLTPMEGYGTDCYVKLNRLGDNCCENLPPAVQQSPGELDSGYRPDPAAGPVPRPKYVGLGLYDAQAKR